MPAQSSGTCCSYLNTSYQTTRIDFLLWKCQLPALQSSTQQKAGHSTGSSTSCGKAAPFLFQGHAWLTRWESLIAFLQHPWVVNCKCPTSHTQWSLRFTPERRKGGFTFSQANRHIKPTPQMQPGKGKGTSKFCFLHQSEYHLLYFSKAQHNTGKTSLYTLL